MLKKITVILSVVMTLTICMTLSVSAATAKIVNVSGEKDDGTPISEDAGILSFIADGDELTRWGGANASDNGDHVAVYFELDKEEIIESLDISWFRGHERIHTIALEVSNDSGQTWTNVPLQTDKSVPNFDLLTPEQMISNDAGSHFSNFPLTVPVAGKSWKIKFFPREDAPAGVPTGEMNDIFSVFEVIMNIGVLPAVTSAPAASEEISIPVAPAAPAGNSASEVSSVAPKTADFSVFVIAILAIIGISTALILKRNLRVKI